MVFGIANLENRFGIVSGWHHLLSIFNFEIYKLNLLYFLNAIPLIILIKITYEKSLTDINKIHQIFQGLYLRHRQTTPRNFYGKI